MPPKDIGNGIVLPDYGAATSLLLQLRDKRTPEDPVYLDARRRKEVAEAALKENDVRNLETTNQKARFDAFGTQSESIKKFGDATQTSLGLVLQGRSDEGSALYNSLLKSVDPNAPEYSLSIPGDPKAASQGLIQATNVKTGEQKILNPYADTILKNNFDFQKFQVQENYKNKFTIESEKRAFERQQLDKARKEVTDNAQRALDERRFSTYAEALQDAKARAVATYGFDPFQESKKSPPPTRPTSLPDDLLTSRAQAGVELSSVVNATKYDDFLNKRAIKRTPLDAKNQEEFTNSLNLINSGNQILSLSADLAKDSTFGSSIWTTPIQSLLNNTQISQDPRFVALNQMLDTNILKTGVKFGGTTMTDKFQEFVSQTLPQRYDTFLQKVAKSSALAAGEIAQLQDKLSVLKASDVDTDGIEKLISQKTALIANSLEGAPQDAVDAVAQTIWDKMPASLKADDKFMNHYTEAMPPELRSSFDNLLAGQSRPRPKAVERNIKGLLGVE